VPPGRHRGEDVRRPRPTATVRRFVRDARLPVASVGVAAAVVSAATVAAAVWPNAQPQPTTAALTATIGQWAVSRTSDAVPVGAGSRTEERTSRDRGGSPAPTTTAPGTAPIGTAVAGAGPGHAPAARAGSAAKGVSDAPCPISASIEAHLTANAHAVYRAVCAAFGHSVSSFGGYRAGSSGDHGTGRAVDIMVSGDPGLAIARYVQAHAEALHVTYVIYQQKIWLSGRPTSQWTPMEDRGSRTANHYDHVHVSVS
jgi:hypothetical protein